MIMSAAFEIDNAATVPGQQPENHNDVDIIPKIISESRFSVRLANATGRNLDNLPVATVREYMSAPKKTEGFPEPAGIRPANRT